MNLFIIPSCKINGTTQGLHGYQKKTDIKYPGFITALDHEICEKNKINSRKVIKINGLDLAPCLSDNRKTLIYLWQPKCSAERCISPANLQNLCDEMGARLFIVAEYYDYDIMYGNMIDSLPIYGIDQDYYGTSLTRKYKTGFLMDLGVDTLKPKQDDLFFYFEDGRFLSSNGDIRTSKWMKNKDIEND